MNTTSSMGLRPVPTAATTGAELPDQSRVRGGQRSITGTTDLQLLVGLAGLVVTFIVLFPDTFASVQNLANMATVGGILLVVAIGQTTVLLVGGLDLSVSANTGFVSIVAALHMTGGGSVTTGIAVGLVAGTLVGLVNGILIAYLRITPVVATLGMLTFLGGYANQLSNAQSVPGLPNPSASSAERCGVSSPRRSDFAAQSGAVVVATSELEEPHRAGR